MPLGNRTGWTISAVIALAYVGVITLVSLNNRATAPTPLTTSPDAMAVLDLPPIVDEWGKGKGGDATEFLARIAQTVNDNRDLYESFVETPGIDVARMGTLTVLNDVLVQRDLNVAIPVRPEVVVGYKPSPFTEALSLAGRAASRVGMYYRAGKRTEDARRYFEAEFQLGRKVYNNRQTYGEMLAGLGMMGEGMGGLKLLARDAQDFTEVGKIAAVEAGLAEVTEKIRPYWEAISTVDPITLSRHDGDIPVLAKSSKERVWRVEATLKLGRLKYDVGATGTKADQEQAKRLISTLSSDPDPAVALAAKLADALTIEDYRTLR